MTTAVVFDLRFRQCTFHGACARQSWRRHRPHLRLPVSLEADGPLACRAWVRSPHVWKGLKKVDGDRVIYDRIRAGRPVLGVRGRADHVRTRSGARCPCRRHRTDRRFGEPAGRRRGASHGMGHDRGRPRFGAAQRRGERTVLLRALLRRDGSEAGGYVPLRHRSERFARTRELVLVRPIALWAAYEHGPLSATQFHPEKSGDAGSQLLKNWIATL